MEFFKRAIKNTTRNYGKAILLLITFSVIINLILVGFSINNAGDSITDNIRKKLGSNATYELNYDKFYDDMNKNEDYSKTITPLSIKTAEKISKLKHVDGYYITINGTMKGSKSHEVYYDEKKKDKFIDWLNINDENKDHFKVIAGNSNIPSDFKDKKVVLKEGRFYSKEEVDSKAKVVVISTDVAKKNGYKLGDSITLKFVVSEYDSSWNIKANHEVTGEFKIVGLYDVLINDNNRANAYSPVDAYKQNEIYVPYTSYIEMDEQRYNLELSNVIYYYGDEENETTVPVYSPSFTITYRIDDPKNLESFKEEASKLLTSDYHKIDINDEQFKQLSAPIESVKKLSTLITIVIISFGTIIISLVTALSLKDRKYEIGILLSLGESKSKIVSQIFMELFIVSFVAFAVSIGTGTILNKTVGDKLLMNNIEIKNEEDEFEPLYYDSKMAVESVTSSDMITSPYYSNNNDIDMEDLKNETSVSLSLGVLVKVAVSGLLIIFISTIIPAMLIMRYNPKRILTDR